ncbi:hypothetical protein M514_00327 [Trichuris suis]|uniref:Uncharacterized protein n=1 Tax=Trichuris suis TaxID=68888 RepID=A0A085NGK8_9BILA|nr:hypothetical protein M513_00327 [Trichuris suis]KFD68604.1 hypothetical protein M514_00327 [Trichuris suis]
MKAIRFAYSDEALLPSLPEAARLVQESRVRSFGCSKEERDDAYNLNLKRSNGSLNGFPLHDRSEGKNRSRHLRLKLEISTLIDLDFGNLAEHTQRTGRSRGKINNDDPVTKHPVFKNPKR